jgi:septal ring factor EnvC (AmiA/AmiB activator)
MNGNVQYAQVGDSSSLYDQVQTLNTTVAELEAQRRQLQKDNVELRERVRELEEANAWMEKETLPG